MTPQTNPPAPVVPSAEDFATEIECKLLQDLQRQVQIGYWVDPATLQLIREHVAAHTVALSARVASLTEEIEELQRNEIESVNNRHAEWVRANKAEADLASAQSRIATLEAELKAAKEAITQGETLVNELENRLSNAEAAEQERSQQLATLTALGAKWQPIETAPKDGTSVLLVWHWDSGIHTGIAVVLASWGCRTHSMLSSMHTCPIEPEHNCELGWGPYAGKFSHWMPLPATPQPPPATDQTGRTE